MTAIRRTLLAAALSFLVWVVPPAQAEALRVCLLEDDLPRADRAEAAGFDHDLFREVANRLDRSFVPVWRPNAPSFSEIDDSDLPLDELLEGECDLVPSVPGQVALGRLEAAITLSQPYYAAAFELYLPAGANGRADIAWENLVEAAEGRKVAVRLQSLGHFAAQAAGLDWTSRTASADVVAAVEDGLAVAALIWGPALARLQRAPAEGFVPPAGLRFNEHAATRSVSGLGRRIDEALEALRSDGTIERLAAKYHIPRTEPFASVSSAAAIRALGIGVSD